MKKPFVPFLSLFLIALSIYGAEKPGLKEHLVVARVIILSSENYQARLVTHMHEGQEVQIVQVKPNPGHRFTLAGKLIDGDRGEVACLNPNAIIMRESSSGMSLRLIDILETLHRKTLSKTKLKAVERKDEQEGKPAQAVAALANLALKASLDYFGNGNGFIRPAQPITFYEMEFLPETGTFFFLPQKKAQ